MNNDLIIKQNEKIIKLIIKRKAKKIGNGSYVLLPKDMVGKEVEIKYKQENETK